MNFSQVPVTDIKFKEYMSNKSSINNLLPNIRVQFLGQLNDSVNNGIKFSDNDRLKRLRIIKCYKRILADKTLDKKIRLKIGKYTEIISKFEDVDKKIITIATALSMNKEDHIKNLYELAIKNPAAIESQYKLLIS